MEDGYAVLKRFFGPYLPEQLPTETPIAEFLADISETLPDTISDCGDILVNELKRTAPEFFEEYRREINGFTKRLQEEWRAPLDLLERTLILSMDSGREFLADRRRENPSDIGFLHVALVGLHARGCQVANEILRLLSGGFADGAHARWRTLHELAVTASFIAEHGEELAERYLLHQYVEAHKEALIYREHEESLGLEPLPDSELRQLASTCDELCTRFGQSFRLDYGWASEVLAPESPTFARIRKMVGLSHLHPQYKLACQNVHGAAKALFFRLGVPGELKHFPITLAGPSNAGLADPGIQTAQALLLLTCSLLGGEDTTFERLVVLDALTKTVRSTQEAFFEVHQRLESR